MSNLRKRSDLATVLTLTGSDLRVLGTALMGIAHIHHVRGDREFGELQSLALSADRVADLLEAVSGRLCQDCRLIEVREEVTVTTGKGKNR
jgi:hypothetical protein